MHISGNMNMNDEVVLLKGKNCVCENIFRILVCINTYDRHLLKMKQN